MIKYEGKGFNSEIDLDLEYGWYDRLILPRGLFVVYWVQPCTVGVSLWSISTFNGISIFSPVTVGLCLTIHLITGSDLGLLSAEIGRSLPCCY